MAIEKSMNKLNIVVKNCDMKKLEVCINKET